jgi:hypothetical protein
MLWEAEERLFEVWYMQRLSFTVSFLIAYYTAVNKTTQQKHPRRRLRSRFISSTDPLTLSCVKL